MWEDFVLYVSLVPPFLHFNLQLIDRLWRNLYKEWRDSSRKIHGIWILMDGAGNIMVKI